MSVIFPTDNRDGTGQARGGIGRSWTVDEDVGTGYRCYLLRPGGGTRKQVELRATEDSTALAETWALLASSEFSAAELWSPVRQVGVVYRRDRFVGGAPPAQPSPQGSQEPLAAGRRYVLFQVEGMRSGECVHKLEGALIAVPGVVCAKVDLNAGTARVLGTAPLPGLEAAIVRAGYTPVPAKRIRRLDTDQLVTQLGGRGAEPTIGNGSGPGE